MRSLILNWSARYILWTALAFSIFVLFRGHNEPGGGFIGGLIAAAGIALYAVARGVEETRTLLRVDPKVMFGFGLTLAALSGIPAFFVGGMPFLDHLWFFIPLGGVELPLGTALIFDIGVWLVVVGAVLEIFLEMAEA